MNKIDDFHGQYRFLSNFWQCDIEYLGQKFKSTEHAYQAHKTTNHADFTKVVEAATPGESKKIVRKFPQKPDWEKIKDQIMLDLLRIKFSKPGLGKALLDTGDAELIEGNTWNDTYWGVCKGVGQNKLGKMLMQVREELRDKSAV